jgi:hypothetical protein
MENIQKSSESENTSFIWTPEAFQKFIKGQELIAQGQQQIAQAMASLITSKSNPKQKLEKKIKKPSKISGYNIFSAEQFKKCSATKDGQKPEFGVVNKQISALWNTLTKEERDHYNAMALKRNAEKIKEFEESGIVVSKVSTPVEESLSGNESDAKVQIDRFCSLVEGIIQEKPSSATIISSKKAEESSKRKHLSEIASSETNIKTESVVTKDTDVQKKKKKKKQKENQEVHNE